MKRLCLVGLGLWLGAGTAAAQLPPRYPTTTMPSMTEWPSTYSPYWYAWGYPYRGPGYGPGWSGMVAGGAYLGPGCIGRGNLVTTFLVESERVPAPAPGPVVKAPAVEPGPVKLGGLKWRGPNAFVDVQGRQWRRIGGVPIQPLPDELAGWALSMNDGRHLFYTNTGQIFALLPQAE